MINHDNRLVGEQKPKRQITCMLSSYLYFDYRRYIGLYAILKSSNCVLESSSTGLHASKVNQTLISS